MNREHANLNVGRADTTPSRPAHTPGVREGNAPGGYESMAGHEPDGTSTARRSTGINPSKRNPMTPGAPNLSPP
jgi:hypothetical protein